jgi:hypothetical protein
MYQGADNKNRLYYADLGNPKAPKVSAPIRRSTRAATRNTCRSAERVDVFVRTDKDAPNRAS